VRNAAYKSTAASFPARNARRTESSPIISRSVVAGLRSLRLMSSLNGGANSLV
jgi:hypothetical protein